MAGRFALADEQLAKRHRKESIAKGFLMFGASISIAFLATMIVRLFMDGTIIFQGTFWTNRYLPSGIRTLTAGVADSILATLITLAITMVAAIPVGTAAGVYLHEYAKPGRLTDWISATVSNLAAVPSIVYGLLGFAIFKILLGFGASFLSAGLTLGVLILPILIVSTEEALKTVPDEMRQASLAMGATKWQTVRSHVLPYAMPNILTGQILALSRAAGETAPLIAIGIPTFQGFLSYGIMDSGTPLQMRAYSLALDHRAEAHVLAGGAVLVLLLVTLLLNLAAIVLRQRLSNRIKW